MSKEVSVEALRGVSFEVQKGEFISVVGSSGSGKSTLLNILGGLDFEYTGKISIDGKNIKEYNPNFYRRNIVGTIFQQFYLIPSLSVEENILLPLKFVKNRNIDVNERLESLLEMVDLKNRRKHFPKELSGGQAQRVAIARALIDNPKVVLADEPISSLDVSIRAQVLNLLRDLQEQNNLTYIFIAHDLSIIKYISDRIAVMHQGYVVELGTAESIYSNPVHPYTKSLLTAIPQPDPASKDDCVKVIYNKGNMDYEKMDWIEVVPEHFVLGTPELIKKWTKKK